MKKLSQLYVNEQFENEGYELLSEYKNAITKLKVKCPNDHIINIRFNDFRQGIRCSICSGKRKLDYKSVKNIFENEGYELLSNDYKNNYTKLKVKCPNDHEYSVTLKNFNNGIRCKYCFYEKIKNNFFNIKETIKNEGYELLSNNYKNNKNFIKIKCNKGHEYETRYDNFNKGCRCPVCSKIYSNAEKEIVEYLKSLNVNIIENDRELIKPLELDMVIPDKKIAIEYCGLYWHSEKYKDKNYHLNKLELSNKTGYRLITIFEDEWLYKKDIVKNRLKYILGLNTEKIYARKCEIRKIQTKKAREFINKYHIQGYNNCKIKLGAFYNDELVAVMTFSKLSISKGNKKIKNDIFELNRFCSSVNVVGIASKFFKYFQRNYEYEKIITFADRRWSEGDLYEKIGMRFIKNTKPNYWYFKNGIFKRYHRFNFRKNVLKDKLENFNSNLTEYDNMLNNDWDRIHDCGNIKYDFIKGEVI